MRKLTAALVSRVPVFASPMRAPGLWSARVRPKPASAVAMFLALAACAEKHELPPIPPAADMCSLYSSYRYSAAAAAVEIADALDKHNANERVFYDRCVTNHPKLDPDRKGGPR